MTTLSTHVLDTALGSPARGVRVTLSTAAGETLGEGRTDGDGRVASLGGELTAGAHVLTFAVGDYHAATGQPGFYPRVDVTVTVTDEDHLHVPLLLSPFGYSTYRGS